MTSLRIMLPTLWRLGPGSVLSVALYRLANALGVYRRILPIRVWQGSTDFFEPEPGVPPAISEQSREAIAESGAELLRGSVDYYGWIRHDIGNPPDWFLDPLGGNSLRTGKHWSDIDEFVSCDIKNVWEASRFQWLLVLAQAWRLTGDERFPATINGWLADWVAQNPVNQGPNWKCGQETSIRLITLMLAARLLGTDTRPSIDFVRLVEMHCARIAPTIRYAVAQNNNHGTSEAAALFIGGAWLLRHAAVAGDTKAAQRWRAQGRLWLEDRVGHLVAEDGSFSQYSINYQRLLVDTLSQVELWRAELQEPAFSFRFVSRSQAAVSWLSAMTDEESGDAPNLGANDGARLFDLSCVPYRDFRPSVQLASVLFLGRRAYQCGSCDEPLTWLGIEAGVKVLPKRAESELHCEGGYVTLRASHSWSLLRFAAYRFRPSHCDCLHLDLWHRGRNILRDGGSFSYNTESRWLDYFSGTESHNTVQFDGRDQMPRIGRFLFGDWLRMDVVGRITTDGDSQSWSGAYTDRHGASHRRTVSVRDDHWTIVDDIAGVERFAVLRWRLFPDDWRLAGNACESRFARLQVNSSTAPRRLELTVGWESIFYQQKTELPVLEIETGPGSCRIQSDIVLKD